MGGNLGEEALGSVFVLAGPNGHTRHVEVLLRFLLGALGLLSHHIDLRTQ